MTIPESVREAIARLKLGEIDGSPSDRPLGEKFARCVCDIIAALPAADRLALMRAMAEGTGHVVVSGEKERKSPDERTPGRV